jgi:hypothetical protein
VEIIKFETGIDLTKLNTYYVETGRKKPCGHYYFLHNDESIAMGNRKCKGFEARCDDQQCVSPGSTHYTGAMYKNGTGTFLEAPSKLIQWIIAESRIKAKNDLGTRGHAVTDAFDIYDFADHYNLTHTKHGDWYWTDICPVCEYKHQQSFSTGFYYDGEFFGFNCFAAGCPGSTMTVGQVIKHLNLTHEPYKGVIWPDQLESTLQEFEVEEVEVDDSELDEETEESEEDTEPIETPPVIATGINFDERALYGKLGKMAGESGLPLGWMYPALLTVGSATGVKDKDDHIRPNLYTNRRDRRCVIKSKTEPTLAALHSLW